MYVPRAAYSLRMSFWIVPPSFAGSTPCSSATIWYRSSKSEAGALIVMEVVTEDRSIPSNSRRMSSSVLMATPTRPTSARAAGWSES